MRALTSRSNRLMAVVDPVSLLLVVVIAGGALKLSGWKPSELWRKKPPTEQVAKLQQELVAAQTAAEQARLEAERLKAAELARKDEQVRWAQQMGSGAAESLSRVPGEHQTPEVRLAAELIGRGNFALAMAVGDIPAERRAEILKIVDGMLSKVEADRDAARAALEKKDVELRTITRERDIISAQIPVAIARAEAREADAKAAQAELTVKTNQLAIEADKLDRTAREAGSLGAALNRVLFWACVIAGGWFFLVWGLPPLLKLMRPGRTKNVLREISGWSHGFLYLDAKKKLAELQQRVANPSESP